MSTDYILGNDQEELSRLKLQHDLWRKDLINLWDRSKLTHLQKGSRVLDLGCGPGFTSLDLLQYTQSKIDLTSVDISDKFLSYLKTESEINKLNIQLHKTSVENLDLTYKKYDAAFCRWLMIFVQNPDLAVRQIASHLKPGAEYILQEYVSYDSMDLVPNSKYMKAIVAAIFKSWKDQGGDPNRGKYLPQILEKSGFKIKYMEPVAKFALPSDELWQWPDSFYKSFLPRLLNSGYITAEQLNGFFEEWAAARNSAGTFFVAPTVINIIAVKS